MAESELAQREGPARKHVHPFPARMAPDLALAKIDELTNPGGTVLDPMCGSGTVIRLAGEHKRLAIGADIDPLAVLITRAACHPTWARDLAARADELVDRAARLSGKLPDWIKRDKETEEFVSYWFGPEQAGDLSRLARVLEKAPLGDDPLRVALSRIIVTKEMGASLARDTSHSRPHRVADTSNFDVLEEYVRSAKRLELLGDTAPTVHKTRIRRADARALSFVRSASVDLTLTSPPYLNAIDYLRGHKMTLVWLGWTIPQLRKLRSESVGVERALEGARPAMWELARRAIPGFDDLPTRWQGIVVRFTQDVDRLARSLARVTKRDGHLVLVVADSQLRGVPISNSSICAGAVTRHGFDLVDETVRPLPARMRYLPPPATSSGTLSQRMNEEIVFTFRRK